MAVEEPPVGFLQLHSIVRWRLLNLSVFWVMLIIGSLSMAFSVASSNPLSRILSLMLGALFLAVGINSLLHELRPLKLIAVNLGHPWIAEDHDVEHAEVAFRTADSNWLVLPSDSGMSRMKAGSSELVLTTDDVDVPLTVFSSKSAGMMTVHWLNTALALRDAQNSTEEDSIEAARSREEQESVMLQREWGDTSEGQFDIKPGILFRGFSKSPKNEK